MILGNEKILEELGKNIVIEPYDEKCLNPNSYNLHLYPKLKVYDVPMKYNFPKGSGNILHEMIPESITFMNPLDMKADNPTHEIIIPEDGLTLYPGILYLGMTNEFTATDKYLPMLEGRSSIGRLGINIHATAGFGDVGFKGRWTLEISCVQPVKIYPNIEICQIYYQEVEGNTKPYNGKYQNSMDIGSSKFFKEFENTGV